MRNNRKKQCIYITALFAILITSCKPGAAQLAPTATHTPDAGITFPRLKPSEGESACMAALLVGTLQLDGECLYVLPLEGEGKLLPVWPPDYTLHMEGNQAQVLNAEGQVAARVGDEVWMGGGEAEADAWVAQQIPVRCSGQTFIACGGVRLNLIDDSDLFTLDMLPHPIGKLLFLRYTPALDEQVDEPASLEGTLVAYASRRCIHLQTDAGMDKNLFWPEGWTARIEEDTVTEDDANSYGAAVSIRDETGSVVALLGEPVRLRGRELPHNVDFPAYRQLIDEMPGDCTGASWLVDAVE